MTPGGQSYVLGHSERELDRLARQARLISPITRRFFTEAGIGPGMRVLDVGSGAGDVSFLVAQLVGETGEVVGADRSADAVATATERAKAASLHNVSFRVGDPADMAFDALFDAVVGRYVLMYQADPASMVKALASKVRPGSVVVFHEPDRAAGLSFPPVPSYDRGYRLFDEACRHTGADPRMGIKLHSVFLAAGLGAPTMRLEAVIGGAIDGYDEVHFEMDVVETIVPELERLGVLAPGEIEPDGYADRVVADVIASGSIVVGRAEIAAWTRTAGKTGLQPET